MPASIVAVGGERPRMVVAHGVWGEHNAEEMESHHAASNASLGGLLPADVNNGGSQNDLERFRQMQVPVPAISLARISAVTPAALEKGGKKPLWLPSLRSHASPTPWCGQRRWG